MKFLFLFLFSLPVFASDCAGRYIDVGFAANLNNGIFSEDSPNPLFNLEIGYETERGPVFYYEHESSASSFTDQGKDEIGMKWRKRW